LTLINRPERKCIRWLYRWLSWFLYPLVAILKATVPIYRTSPHYAVATLTVGLFAIAANLALALTGHAIVFAAVLAGGMCLAYAFALWGGESNTESRR
jgi:hypothetical protein